jgi:uncharacterized protein (DUF1810 family)
MWARPAVLILINIIGIPVTRVNRVAAPHNRGMGFDLERFATAQDRVYGNVLEELRAARKTSHWMWFVFPQVSGLGRSAVSERSAIAAIEEARAYLAHPVLGARIRECSRLVLASGAQSAEVIFGSIDARKLRSSMTLFHRAAPADGVFPQVLDRFFGGVADRATDTLLEADTGPGGALDDAGPAEDRHT